LIFSNAIGNFTSLKVSFIWKRLLTKRNYEIIYGIRKNSFGKSIFQIKETFGKVKLHMAFKKITLLEVFIGVL
jgi:hypothetical protein